MNGVKDLPIINIPKLNPSRRRAFQTLSYIFKPGDHRLEGLIQEFGTPEALVEALKNGSVTGLDLDTAMRGSCFNSYIYDADRDENARFGVRLMVREDPDFPKGLMEMPQPPLVMYLKGTSSVLARDCVAIIGSRKATSYSITVTENFSMGLAAKGYTIVSGFAKGIDTAAHRSAMAAGGKTAAVLGCGIGYDYPRNTMPFKDEIAKDGAVISEYPASMAAATHQFPVRNRIIAGLSKAVLVIQAGKKSGCHNTVSHALDQGKMVFVIPPHDLYDERYAGNVSLLMDGAVPVYSPEDMIEKLKDQIY